MEISRLLINAGSDLESENFGGYTALTSAEATVEMGEPSYAVEGAKKVIAMIKKRMAAPSRPQGEPAPPPKRGRVARVARARSAAN